MSGASEYRTLIRDRSRIAISRIDRIVTVNAFHEKAGRRQEQFWFRPYFA
jgi:hypothetical protein